MLLLLLSLAFLLFALHNELPEFSGGQRVILHGQRRVLLRKVVSATPTLRIEVSPFPARGPLTLQQQAHVAQVRARAKALVRADPTIPKSAEALIDSVKDPESVLDLIAGNLAAPDEVKLRIFAASFEERLPLILERLARSL